MPCLKRPACGRNSFACAAPHRLRAAPCARLPAIQVGYGVLQLICGLGSPGGAEAAVDPPARLAPLLHQYGLPAGPLRAAEEGVEADPGQLMKGAGGAGNWERACPCNGAAAQRCSLHPAACLPAASVAHPAAGPRCPAVAAAWQLPALKAQLEADLGPAASLRVEHLSRAWAEWHLPAAQHSYAAAEGGEEAGEGGGEADKLAAEGGDEAWIARLLERASLYD